MNPFDPSVLEALIYKSIVLWNSPTPVEIYQWNQTSY